MFDSKPLNAALKHLAQEAADDTFRSVLGNQFMIYCRAARSAWAAE